MNKLLTAVEKMFLEIDADTRVRSRYVDVKSKRSLF